MAMGHSQHCARGHCGDTRVWGRVSPTGLGWGSGCQLGPGSTAELNLGKGSGSYPGEHVTDGEGNSMRRAFLPQDKEEEGQ